MKIRLALRVLIVLAAAAILPACRHLPHHHRPHVLGEPRGVELPAAAQEAGD